MAPPYTIPAAGVSAASFFDPTIIDPASPAAQLADDIDSATGDLRSLFSTPNPVHAAVQFAFTLQFGSGAATNGRGHKFAKIRKMSPSIEIELRNEISRILEPFITQRLVDDVKITVRAPNPDSRVQGDFVVDFRELLTGTAQQVRR